MNQKVNSNLLKKNKFYNWLQFNDFKTNEEISFYLYKNSVISSFLRKIFFKSKLYLIQSKLYQTNNRLHIHISYFHAKTRPYSQFFNSPNHSEEDERSLLIKKVIKTLDNYTKNKVDFYIILKNVQKYLIKLRYLFAFTQLKKQSYFIIRKYENRYSFAKSFALILFLVLAVSNSAQLFANYISSVFKLKNYKREHFKIFKLIKILTKRLLTSKFSIYKGLKVIISGRINGFARAKTRMFQHGRVPLNTFNVIIHYAFKTAFTKNGTIGIKVWFYERKKRIY